MLLEVHPDRTPTAALPKPPFASGSRLESWFMLLRKWDKPGWLRAALTAAAFFGVAAFVLGAGNRLTQGPWFVYAPEVSLVWPKN